MARKRLTRQRAFNHGLYLWAAGWTGVRPDVMALRGFFEALNYLPDETENTSTLSKISDEEREKYRNEYWKKNGWTRNKKNNE